MANVKSGSPSKVDGKGTKDKPISKTQQRRNHRIAKTRARVKHVFARLTHRLQSRALNQRFHAQLCSSMVAAYKFQRLVYLKEAKIEAF